MTGDLVGELVRSALAASPWQVPHVVTRTLTRHLGAVAVDLLYADHAQRHLTPLDGSSPHGGEGGWPVGDGDGPGGVFAAQTARTGAAGGPARVDLPLSARGERLGVLRLAWAGPDLPGHLRGPEGRELLDEVADAVALLLQHADAGTDRIERWRRSHDFSLAAELQWRQLPAQSLLTPSVTVAAHLEPAAHVTSDLYDWSTSPAGTWFALLDATGPQGRRGLASAQTATLALTALRNARRAGADLGEQAWLADQAVADHERGESRVSALVAQVDAAGEHVEVVGAGSPVLLRGAPGRQPWTVPALTDHPPLGEGEHEHFRGDRVAVGPGQWLVALSDGVVQARDGSGEPFGLARLRAVLDHGGPALDAPRRIIEAVTAHGGDGLDDDACAVVVARVPGAHGGHAAPR